MNKKLKVTILTGLWLIVTSLIILFYNLNNDRLSGVYNATSNQNRKRIELYLFDYHTVNGKYPPLVYQRKPGEPFHSWRVLLLAHMPDEASEVYAKYDFSKEWNSPSNLEAIGNYIPKEYYIDEPTSITPYLSYDTNNEWPFGGWMKSCIYNKDKDKFIIVENPNSDVHWAEPRF